LHAKPRLEMAFKNTIWKAAALHMVAYTEKGDPKIASAYKNKWA
jgi:hypothetical protein